MLLRFLKSRLFIFLSILFFVCFIAGYDYAVLTSREPPAAEVKAPVATAGDGAADTGSRSRETEPVSSSSYVE